MFLSRKERKAFKWSLLLIGKVILFIITLSFSIILLSFQLFRNLYKLIINYIHFRKININYLQIQKFINTLSGRQFEIFMYQLFKANNYKVKLTEETCDGGKDLIIYDKKKGTTYVELKRWNGSFKVGRPEVQKLVGAMIGDKADNSLFITTGQYTREAVEYANKVDNLDLWDMTNIIKMINKTKANKLPFIFARIKMEESNDELINVLEGVNDGLNDIKDQLE